jgi:hypothetical protein
MSIRQPDFEPIKFDSPTVAIPYVELMQNPAEAAQLSQDESFLDQVKTHQSHIASVNNVIDRLSDPTMTLETALRSSVITNAQATDFYHSLADILDDEDYSRLALYLPFEYFMDRSGGTQDAELNEASDRFKASYLRAWRQLLDVHDVRASFVDGDILEHEYCAEDVPRVVKAAHLIPGLIRCGLLTEDDAASLLHSAENPGLRRSITEALAEYHQLNFDATESVDQSCSAPISEGRAAWLDQEKRDERIMDASAQVAAAITSGESADTVIGHSLQPGSGRLTMLALAEGIYGAIAVTLDIDSAAANRLYDQYQDILSTLLSFGDVELASRLTSIYWRLHHLSVVGSETLDNLDIPLPRLDGPFSENLSLMTEQIENLQHISRLIESDPELSSYVYPIIAVGGSRLKGYGIPSSDIDTSVFIKPGTPESVRPRLHQLLNSVFSTGSYDYDPIEFWLEDSVDEQLRVHDFDNPDRHTADSYWTHVLFGGAWVGDERAITELRSKLLPNYFCESEHIIDGRTSRQFYLERIEQDVLQYRLMHKGYRRHFPLRRSQQSRPGPAVDGDSVFWDPGYRQLATKLYISSVFLPKIT